MQENEWHLPLDSRRQTLIGPTVFDEIRRICKHYEGLVEGKYTEYGIASRYLNNLARDIKEQVKHFEGKAKQATSEQKALTDALQEYLEVFRDEDTMWETLDLAYDPEEQAPFTRQSILTPKVLHSALSAYRHRVVALISERDALRTRRMHDLAHFEASIAELKHIHADEMCARQDDRQQSDRALHERLRAEQGKVEALTCTVSAMRARAERAEAQLRQETERRAAEARMHKEQAEIWEAERRSLMEECMRSKTGAHLLQIAQAHDRALRQISRKLPSS